MNKLIIFNQDNLTAEIPYLFSNGGKFVFQVIDSNSGDITLYDGAKLHLKYRYNKDDNWSIQYAPNGDPVIFEEGMVQAKFAGTEIEARPKYFQLELIGASVNTLILMRFIAN